MPHLPSNSMTPQPGGTVPKVTPSPSSSSASVNTGIRGSTSPVQSKGNTENEPEPEDDTTVQQTSTKRKEETFSKWLQVVEYDKAKSGTDPKSVATLEIAGLKTDPNIADVRTQLGDQIEADQAFCFPDGSPAADTLSLTSYFHRIDETREKKKLANDEEPQVIPRKIWVFPPKEIAPAPKAKAVTILSKPPFVVNIFQWQVPSEGSEGELMSRGTMHSKIFDGTDASLVTLAGLRKKIAAVTSMSTGSKIHKFCTSKGVTVADETMTFADYLQMEDTDAPENATLPSVMVAYKLNSNINQPKVDMSTLPGAPNTIKADHETGFTDEKSAKSFSAREDRAFTLDAEIKGISGSDEFKSAGMLTESDWTTVIANCGMMYGWVVDRQRNRIVRAPKAAFQLRPKPSDDPVHLIPEVIKKPVPTSTETSDEIEETSESEISESSKDVGSTADNKVPMKSMPSFRVNDDSKIEIISCSHEFETSLASNNFSKHSTEGSITGGFAGFSATVSAGYASSQSSSTINTANTYSKTLVANYLFPRADVFLHPDDLEPTPDLQRAIHKIETEKNVNDLRQLYRDYGHLFCKQVTIGGRLQSTKIFNSTTNTSEQSAKEEFKVSVGLQVSTPFGVGAGMKHETSQGSSTDQKSGDHKERETNVFEAVGGNTILAANPVEWTKSVIKFENWRVINRELLSPIVDTISAISGYSRVKGYFSQAVPVLSKYIELPGSREVKLRFQMTSPTTDLSLGHLKKEKPHITPLYYLGHGPKQTVEPRMHSIKAREDGTFMDMVFDEKSAPTMFTPTKYRAPVIMGYHPDALEHGTTYKQEFMNTVWSVTSPFNEALVHEGIVFIKTVPLEVPQEAPEDGKQAAPSKATHAPSTLSVFRNQQGVFLPAMSDIEDFQYWRVLKVGAKAPGETIKEGDTIRLCWLLKDQKIGFRDFMNDLFGRRRNHVSQDLESLVLYLKMPWPRFEGIYPKESGQPLPNSMVMSPDPYTEKAPMVMNHVHVARAQPGISPVQTMYLTDDVQFRIDTVANDGKGDVNDYMLEGVGQEGMDKVSYAELQERQRQRIIYETFFLGT